MQIWCSTLLLCICKHRALIYRPYKTICNILCLRKNCDLMSLTIYWPSCLGLFSCYNQWYTKTISRKWWYFLDIIIAFSTRLVLRADRSKWFGETKFERSWPGTKKITTVQSIVRHVFQLADLERVKASLTLDSVAISGLVYLIFKTCFFAVYLILMQF